MPGGTERVKDVDGVGHDDKEFVAETVGLLERKEVRLLLGDTEAVLEEARVGEPVVELVVEAVARILFVCVANVVEVLEGALVGLPVCVVAIVTDLTADPETVFVCLEEAVAVELGEAVLEPFSVAVELVLPDTDFDDAVDAVGVSVEGAVKLRLELREGDADAVEVFETGPLREIVLETLGVFVGPGEFVCFGLPVDVLVVLTDPVVVFEIVDVFVDVELDVVVLERTDVSETAELVEGVLLSCAVGVSNWVWGAV